MKLAQFRRTLDGTAISYVTIITEDEGSRSPYNGTGYTRVSEWVDVTFPPRDPEEIIPAQLAALDAAESELRNKFAAKLAEISAERSKLLALTHEEAST